MKIAIYADRLESGGGLETHVITQVNELLRRGHYIYLSANAIAPDFLKLIKGDSSNFRFQLFSPDPLGDLQDLKPDVVHAHPFTAIFRAHKVVSALDVPFLITMHGLYNFGVDRSPNGYPVSKRAFRIIAVDEAVEYLLIKGTAFPEKVLTIYNGINRQQFYPDHPNPELIEELNLDTSWKTIVVVTRLEDGKEKTVLQLLDCASVLAERLHGLNLIITGDGAYREMVWARNQLEIEKCGTLRVYRMGRRTDVSRFLNLADLVLACGRAAIEGMACKRPVFAMSDRGWGGLINRQTRNIIPGREGYHPYPDRELVDNIYNTMIDYEWLTMAVDQCYAMIIEEYDINKLTDRLESLYIEAIRTGTM
jgi:Glycosyltransferase